MDIDKELEVLEILNNIPMPPDPAPVPSIFDDSGLVKMPMVLVDYFKKINVEPELDRDGRMEVEKYLSLLNQYRISNGIKIVSYVKVSGKNIQKPV